MALQSKKSNSTLDDIPGISDDIKRMYAILKRMESTESKNSDISDFDISDIEEELDSDDEPDIGNYIFVQNKCVFMLNEFFFRSRFG